MHRITSLIIAFGCLACALPAAADDLPARLSALGSNEWLAIEPEVSRRLVLEKRAIDSPVKTIESREPFFREYSNPAWDSARGQILYFGGGHSGYYGNDVESFDPAANAWRQVNRPNCPPPDDSTYYSGGSERSFLDAKTGEGQPYVIHGYCRTGYDPALKRFVCTAMFPALAPSPGSSAAKKQAFSYISFDPVKNRWELLAEMPDPLKPGLTSLSYDSDLAAMLAFNEREAWIFRAGKWERFGESKVRLAASGGSGAVYVPSLKSHLIAVLGHGGKEERGALALFSTETKSGKELSSLPQPLKHRIAPGTGAYNLILSYDSKHGRVVVMSVNEERKPDVWTWDPATDTWKQQPVAATAPQLVGPFEPGRGRSPLMYDAARNVFYLLYRHGEYARLWAYRLEK